MAPVNDTGGIEMSMKRAGDKASCPHCQQETVLKEKVTMDGWTVIEKFLGCAICGKKIADILATEKSLTSPKSVSNLAALLGESEDAGAAPILTMGTDEKKFCRDCCHFVKHPFLNRCELHCREVSPMDDCADFSPAISPERPKI